MTNNFGRLAKLDIHDAPITESEIDALRVDARLMRDGVEDNKIICRRGMGRAVRLMWLSPLFLLAVAWWVAGPVLNGEYLGVVITVLVVVFAMLTAFHVMFYVNFRKLLLETTALEAQVMQYAELLEDQMGFTGQSMITDPAAKVYLNAVNEMGRPLLLGELNALLSASNHVAAGSVSEGSCAISGVGN